MGVPQKLWAVISDIECSLICNWMGHNTDLHRWREEIGLLGDKILVMKEKELLLFEKNNIKKIKNANIIIIGRSINFNKFVY